MRDALSKNLKEVDADHRRPALEQLLQAFTDDEIEDFLSYRKNQKGSDEQVDKMCEGVGDD